MYVCACVACDNLKPLLRFVVQYSWFSGSLFAMEVTENTPDLPCF